ncbi:MAG: 5'-methylthioadenosine/S-adenosylhomocysteine nucleosidase [Cellulomonadaceae bacterium]|nr:5'-methylthioadenosine/S-adenosylhomocysteine nucleosidase [Cellulomonadaceae bacterium]
MADESAPFVALADAAGPPSNVGHAVHRLLTFGDRVVLLVQCGIGLVASATATALAVSRTRPSAVISAGSAGGVARGVRVGDVVIGDEYVYPGADARAFGYALGQVPGMPATYAGDPALVAAACAVEVDGIALHHGTMLSGDAFIDAAAVGGIRAAFPHGLSTDMESTAIAQTCHLYGVPFVSVRGISDLCGPVAGEDFLTHVDDAAERSARVVVAALLALPTRVPQDV